MTRSDPRLLPNRPDSHARDAAQMHWPALSSTLAHALRVATLNVRYDTHARSPVPVPDTGVSAAGSLALVGVGNHAQVIDLDVYAERPWAERRSRIVDALVSTGEVDIVGFQEVLVNQLHDLQTLLGPRFAHVGVGRDDGVEAGEFSPIFYDTDRFDLVDWTTVWLSLTPDKPGSIGWDASQTRIATLLTLHDKANEALVHCVNTHYDDRGVRARAESSLVIRTTAHRWATRMEAEHDFIEGPVILFGDFNSPPTEDGYKNITSPLPLSSPSFTFMDAYTHLDARRPGHSGQSAPYGPAKTYTGFSAPGRTRTTRIDFVMLGAETSRARTAPEPGPGSGQLTDHDVKQGAPGGGPVVTARGGWRATRYACIDNWVEEADADGWTGRWSDHRLVRVTLERE
ncbi:hypothetical protein Q5752_005461 [Cryptotrichosporon argae]